MLFNSIDFVVFLPLVFILYWFVCHKNLNVQNTLLIIASYVFYGWWDYRFLALIIFSSLIDFFIGKELKTTKALNRRKVLLGTSVAINLGFLGVFKYYNFFVENFITAFSFLGSSIAPNTLNIILPIGISFYTFQTLSYTIDVYRGKLQPTSNMISFLAFVSFFPQLVAGPIERATNLLPQFFKPRTFHYSKAVDGCKQILWGFFKKIVIADTCAQYANIIFNDYQEYKGSTLVMGALFFTFQIYGDFSGYSDIAIGTSRLFGFHLKQNFAFPYFSRDMAEFWRRWHISLSTWFRDYLYIPLGGSRGGRWMKIRNTFIIFLVSGFWHGANWTFVIWGLLNALYFLPLQLTNKNRTNLQIVAYEKRFPSLKELVQIILTFGLTVLAWVFFRAENVTQAFQYLKQIFSRTLWSIPEIRPTSLVLLILFFVLIEWLGRQQKHALEKLMLGISRVWRWGVYMCIIVVILFFSNTAQQEFIYFQF